MVQILFWFVVGLAGAISGAAVWIAKYILLPLRDGHLGYLKETSKILPEICTTLKSLCEQLKETSEDIKGVKHSQRKITDSWRHGQPPLPAGTTP